MTLADANFNTFLILSLVSLLLFISILGINCYEKIKKDKDE